LAGRYTADALDLMLNALKGTNPTTPVTHVGLYDAGTALTSVTSVTSTDTFTKTSHGMANGTLVLISGLTGGANLSVGRPYFVVNQAANTFQVSLKPGGSVEDHGTDVTAATVTPLIELSGGSPAYARGAIAYSTAANGTMDDSTNGVTLNVPAGATVDYKAGFSASTSGTLLFIDAQSPAESYAGQGTFSITDSDLDLLQGF
jgi:hypothetical protein